MATKNSFMKTGFLVMTLLAFAQTPATAATTSGIDTPTDSSGNPINLVFGVGGNQVGVWSMVPTQMLTSATPITAPNFYYTSDMRLKQNIQPIDGALDKLLAIHGVTFNWKKDGREDMGVLAQNVASVFPAVVTKNQDGYMAIEFGGLMGPIIESIRALKEENDQLRARVAKMDALQAKVDEMEQSLREIKNKQP